MAIKGKKILINPVGGLYSDTPDIANSWQYIKKVVSGFYIDNAVVDIAIPLADILQTVGATVYSTRMLTKVSKDNAKRYSGVRGESQQPRHKECCVPYLKSIVTYENGHDKQFIPKEIYSEGKTFLEQDFNARINYAKYLGVDLMVTIDMNTEEQNDPGMESVCNKNIDSDVAGRLILEETIRRTRGAVHGVSYVTEPTELRHNILTCPSVILKCGSVADRRTTELAELGWYRQWISLGMFAGIWRYFDKE